MKDRGEDRKPSRVSNVVKPLGSTLKKGIHSLLSVCRLGSADHRSRRTMDYVDRHIIPQATVSTPTDAVGGLGSGASEMSSNVCGNSGKKASVGIV